MKGYLKIILALGAAALAGGCGESGGGTPSTDASATAPAEQPVKAQHAAPDAGAPTSTTEAPVEATPTTNGSETAELPGNVTDADSLAGTDEAQEQQASVLDTAEGALRTWIEAMADADYRGVAFATHPDSPVYENFLNMADILEEAETDPSKAQVTTMLRLFFNDPWKDATYEVVVQQDERAQYEVTLTNETVIPMDLMVYNGTWRVMATNEVLRSGSTKEVPPMDSPRDDAGG